MKLQLNFARRLMAIIVLFCLTNSSTGFSQEEQKAEYFNLIDTYDVHCLTAPEGFIEYDGFPGYIHPATSSSISIHVVNNKTIVDAEENLNEEYFRSNGLTFISKKELTVNNGDKALLYKVSKINNEELVYQYTIFVGDMNRVLWISASYFSKYEELVEESLVNSLMTTTLKK